MAINILGLSAYYHDSAAAVLRDGAIVAAAQEERFSRRKQDSRFPRHAVEYCLGEAGLGIHDLDAVIFYDKPFTKLDRLLNTFLAHAPRGSQSFLAAMPDWLANKLHTKSTLRRELASIGGIPRRRLPRLLFSAHHQSHAASAFYPSPFQRAAVLCLDGVGEWASTSCWRGYGTTLEPLWQVDFPHSLGLLYSSFTYFAGFKVDSGEYKLMGLAPYGRPVYRDAILEHLLDLKDDGTFRLDMSYFNFTTGLTMTAQRFADLFGGPARTPESQITQREMDLAASIQSVTEEVVLRLARTVRKETGERHLCMAGGVALNCVANGHLLREKVFDDVWIQPAAGDAGGALGAAFVAWHSYFQEPRDVPRRDAMAGSYLGPRYTCDEIKAYLESIGAPYRRLAEPDLLPEVARLLASEKVIGWLHGRMEFGPRALGARSILGDPRSPRMQSTMNLKIKFRESFRPFAPSVLYEQTGEWFQLDRPSPYMLVCAPVLQRHRIDEAPGEDGLFGIERLKVQRSTVPAVTHLDYSARIQTVHPETNPRFHGLISEFYRLTGCPLVINTSFNVRGEPIVASPEDAYRCFMRTNIDYLVLEDFVLDKTVQPAWKEDGEWRREFVLD